MILGCDAAGVDEDGNEVVVHAVISDPSWPGDETLDPKRSLLSERYQGTFAEQVAVPRRNVVPKPASLSFAEAACLPTAWLTAYRMLFTQGGLKPGDTRAGPGRRRRRRDRADHAGARAAGCGCSRPAVTRPSGRRRSSSARTRCSSRGARLPQRVDAVMETVGAATWSHSIRVAAPRRHASSSPARLAARTSTTPS